MKRLPTLFGSWHENTGCLVFSKILTPQNGTGNWLHYDTGARGVCFKMKPVAEQGQAPEDQKPKLQVLNRPQIRQNDPDDDDIDGGDLGCSRFRDC